MKKLNVALVGLSFGLEFVAIYCRHPDVDKVYVVDKKSKTSGPCQRTVQHPPKPVLH